MLESAYRLVSKTSEKSLEVRVLLEAPSPIGQIGKGNGLRNRDV